LYALLDESAVIRAEHLLGAIAVWHYCEQSVRHIFGDALTASATFVAGCSRRGGASGMSPPASSAGASAAPGGASDT
jgi:hypothetical protein